jgi:FKBP12-rapamycin complex-associated protein
MMAQFFQPICDATLKYRDSREVAIRKAVITLIPNMATFDPDGFEEHYLKSCMSYILQALHKPTDRDIGRCRHLVDILF